MSTLEELFEKLKSQASNSEEKDQLYEHMLSLYESQSNQDNKKVIIETIVEDFVYSNMVFYNKTSKLYFNYVDNHYVVLNEDNMIHHVMEFITNFKKYRNDMNMSLKQLIKQRIFKYIKENTIYENIPDTDTIQSILSILVPTFFQRKEYAKTFLITLGNCVLKKYQNNENSTKSIFFIRNQIKPLLNEINKYISMYFCNNNIFNVFKFKHTQDHQYHEKWVLHCNDVNCNNLLFNGQTYVNLICVAIYYANRYDTIEQYLDSVIGNITEVKDNVYYFQKNNKQSMIEEFTNEYIFEKKDGFMDQNELYFLWKQYTQQKDLFIHVFTSYTDFLNSLFSHYQQDYDETKTNHVLQGFYSMEIPTIQLFRDYWDKHFHYSEEEYYFEISEILHLFHKQYKQKKTNLSETAIVLILQLYYSSFQIVNGKSIHCLQCKSWNKKKEINEFIEKSHVQIKDNVHTLYKKYSMYQKGLKISKKYFSMYIDQLRNQLKQKPTVLQVNNPNE